MNQTSGYSGTPLARKLSLTDGMRVWFDHVPDNVLAEIEAAKLTLSIEPVPSTGLHAAHVFVTERVALEKHLTHLIQFIDHAGFIWVSWPKKGAQVATDITEDTIREIALPMGLVDIKVCSIDETWSGLKLVIRKELR